MNECPSRLDLAQFHVNELDATRRESLTKHLKECSRCTETLARLKNNVSKYERRQDAHAQRLEEALAAENGRQNNVVPFPRRKKLALGATALATAAALIFGVIALFTFSGAEPDNGMIGYKGAFAVSVVAKRGPQQIKVTDGTVLRADDALRFQFQTAKKGYVYIFNVDSKGAITAFYPFNETNHSVKAMKIPSPGNHTMAGSIVLDSARGAEYLVALFSETPFETGIFSEQLAKQMVRSNKTNGDVSKMIRTELLKSASNMDACVIAIEKK